MSSSRSFRNNCLKRKRGGWSPSNASISSMRADDHPGGWKWSRRVARSDSQRLNISILLTINASYLSSSGGLLMKSYSCDAGWQYLKLFGIMRDNPPECELSLGLSKPDLWLSSTVWRKFELYQVFRHCYDITKIRSWSSRSPMLELRELNHRIVAERKNIY